MIRGSYYHNIDTQDSDIDWSHHMGHDMLAWMKNNPRDDTSSFEVMFPSLVDIEDLSSSPNLTINQLGFFAVQIMGGMILYPPRDQGFVSGEIVASLLTKIL